MSKIDKGASRPMVGVSLLVVKDDSILLSRRRKPDGSPGWGTPGGHLKIGESYEECAYRELSEECGAHVRVTMPRFLCLTNLLELMPRHYADVGMVSHWLSGEPENMEPEKCGGWEWHSLIGLPFDRSDSRYNLVTAFHTGQPYFE